jgi:hypothetical protein
MFQLRATHIESAATSSQIGQQRAGNGRRRRAAATRRRARATLVASQIGLLSLHTYIDSILFFFSSLTHKSFSVFVVVYDLLSWQQTTRRFSIASQLHVVDHVVFYFFTHYIVHLLYSFLK